MQNNDNHACREFSELSRRRFLFGSVGAMAAVAGASWLPKVAMAQGGGASRDVLIHIFLRGGIDGLSLAVPFGDPAYYRHRPTQAVPRPDSSSANRALNLDGFFGFPKAFAALLEPYNAKQLAVVHAVGSDNWTRSHFDAMRLVEVGLSQEPTNPTGWLGRHLATSQPILPNAKLRAASLTYGLRQTLIGGPKTLPIPDLDTFGYAGWWSNQTELANWIQASYARGIEPTKSAASDTQATIDLLDRIDFANYKPAGGAVYPEHWFAKSLKSTAALIKSDVGVEAIHLDLDGFDTHSEQGTTDGYLNELLTVLGDSLGAFWKDMNGSNRKNWTSVVLSEFGRTARENSSKGTDHGTANAMLVMGPNVRGKQVVSQWPGLDESQLFQGVDLTPTIDFRDVLAEIVQKRLGNQNLSTVFPAYTPTFRNIVV
ncbi:MAG: DUF1501 domain-containing protein [Fimbriimonas sp.]